MQGQKSDPLLIARTRLQEAVELYQHGKRQEAYQKSVDDYLDGFELVEPDLFAKDAALGRELEGRFTEFRDSIRSGADVTRVRQLHGELESKLANSRKISGPVTRRAEVTRSSTAG